MASGDAVSPETDAEERVMHIIDTDNVNGAYRAGMNLLNRSGTIEESRAGRVIVTPTPVTTLYRRPTERMLFDPVRDANPFFHIMESVWMLAGCNDGRWLDTYVRDFSSRFAEPDGLIHGAYGHRWRLHFGVDQLIRIRDLLYNDPGSRRAVLTMYDPRTDGDMEKRDIPCNTQVFFRVTRPPEPNLCGDMTMTVCNRSNDIIWGAYGANAVHMSIMGEIVAGLAGACLSSYYQISNNFHAYLDIFTRMHTTERSETADPYRWMVDSRPIIRKGEKQCMREEALSVLEDCVTFVSTPESEFLRVDGVKFRSSWFREVVLPMKITHALWKLGSSNEAIDSLDSIQASDIRTACQLWLSRRLVSRKTVVH